MEKGMEKGERANALRVAKRLIKKSFPVAEIAEITGLEVSEIIGLDYDSPNDKD
jgi:hypothetical protein